MAWHFSVSATRQYSDHTLKPPAPIAFAIRTPQGVGQLHRVVHGQAGKLGLGALGHRANVRFMF